MFRYFRDPHNFSTYTTEPHKCELCGEQRPCYEGPFYGLADLDFTCEECIASGRLAEDDFQTNQTDAETLFKQLRMLNPKLWTDDLERMAAERSAEVEQRTPHLVTWQDMQWPAHCGDYCCFIKGAGIADFGKLAPDGNAQAFFQSHLYGRDKETDLDFLWKAVREDSPQNNKESYWTETYLFQCLHCGEYVIRWDCN